MRCNTKARRGDLAAIESVRSATFLKGGTVSEKFFALALVTGVSREGRILRYRVAGTLYETRNTPARALVVSQENCRTTEAFEALAARCGEQWNANEFATVEDVRAFLRPFKRGEAGQKAVKEGVSAGLAA